VRGKRLQYRGEGLSPSQPKTPGCPARTRVGLPDTSSVTQGAGSSVTEARSKISARLSCRESPSALLQSAG